MSDFFAMGGYAAYVWPAFGFAAVVLLGLLAAELAGGAAPRGGARAAAPARSGRGRPSRARARPVRSGPVGSGRGRRPPGRRVSRDASAQATAPAAGDGAAGPARRRDRAGHAGALRQHRVLRHADRHRDQAGRGRPALPARRAGGAGQRRRSAGRRHGQLRADRSGRTRSACATAACCPTCSARARASSLRAISTATACSIASEVLAKHDESYMPPEVADALKAGGRLARRPGRRGGTASHDRRDRPLRAGPGARPRAGPGQPAAAGARRAAMPA